MTKTILHYFVDSNLFIQCRPLEQIDWSPWDTFEEVRLIVSSPVLREIDYRKNKGNDRVGRRARATSAMFRKMLSKGHKFVRNDAPRVALYIESHHRYSKDLEHRLNYEERDDQLIGVAYEFAQHNKSCEVRLLTHDTTPLYTANGLGLTADIIPDEWLLPPETTKKEKEMRALREENTRLKKAEPSFTIRCVDKSDLELKRYHSSHTWFEPLTDEQIDGLMQRLKDRFPRVTDFGSREPSERALKRTGWNSLLGTTEIFTPATDKEIAKYTDETYPNWLNDCEHLLRNHHRALQLQTSVLGFSFLAENTGTRPAADALITIEARGRFRIKPPPTDGRDDEQDGGTDDLGTLLPKVLPPPPVAPMGRWRRKIGHWHQIDAVTRSLLRNRDLVPRASGISDLPSLQFQNPRRDRNAFYYKPDRPARPQSTFSLECDQWRHDDGEINFCGEIHVPTDHDVAKGAIACRIQASNLSKSTFVCIPVEIEIKFVSAFESAQDLVEALLKRPKFRIRPSSKPLRTKE